MSRLTDKPMARAANHLAAGRFPQAVGAYRAVLGIDPGEYQAHVGIAEAEAARGNLEGAMEGLLAAAEAYGEDENYVAALALFGHALGMDPTRLELHLDVAIYESAAGHHAAAIERCEALAEMYVRAGRSDESEEIFRFLASWEPGEVSREHSVPLKVALQASSPIVVAATQSDSQWPASEPLPAGMVPPQQDMGGVEPYGAPMASEPPVHRSSGTAPQQPIAPAPGGMAFNSLNISKARPTPLMRAASVPAVSPGLTVTTRTRSGLRLRRSDSLSIRKLPATVFAVGMSALLACGAAVSSR